MARRDQYIKSRTDYVYRKKHTVTNDGTIYENDHMTIVPDDDVYSDDAVMFSDSNFKFRLRTDINGKKRHFSGKWATNADGEEYWTEDDCSAVTTTSETKIELKPNYSSMKDFAYYGSAVELLKATVRDVILRFPAGIYYLADSEMMYDGKYVVSNEFEIDIWSKKEVVEEGDNPLRTLSVSYGKYLLYGTQKINSVVIEPMNECVDSVITKTIINNSVILYTYVRGDGKRIILSDTMGVRGKPIICLSAEDYNKEYDKLDDFEKVLLNLDTKPKFTAVLDTPRFDGENYYYTKKAYTWPSITDGTYYTPDLSSTEFNAYLTSLMELAKFHDEFDSDNIWRMLTHDSIKNLDWTFMEQNDNEANDVAFDSSRVKGAVQLYGRMFDDLKRYTDNIKNSNAITYDERNNLPDYFLTDNVEEDGWAAPHVGPTTDDTIYSNVLHTGSTYSGKNSTDANISFMRTLSLNSNYIQSMKGTKRGLKTILGLFGLQSGTDYSIKEYVAIADNFPTKNDMWHLLSYNEDYYYSDDILDGWPVTVVAKDDDNKYLIPWFDKNENYNSGLYFQQFGGWEKTKKKKIDLPISDVKEITDMGDAAIYRETLQYMKYARDLSELTALTLSNLFKNCVCYVEDISGLEDFYEPNEEDKAIIDELGAHAFSHYFTLKNESLSFAIGFVDNEFYHCYGWRNVLNREFESAATLTCDGVRVLYLESLKTNFHANNPHVGYGLYDYGDSYVDHYNHLFTHEIDEKKFSMLSDSEEDKAIMSQIETFGFDAQQVAVDKKCFFFEDSTVGSVRTVEFEEGADRQDGGFDNSNKPTPEGSTDSDLNRNNWGSFYNQLSIPPMEAGMPKTDECAAFSIINLKRMEIDFTTYGNTYYKEYIENVIIRYLEQMVPATTIFGYSFDGEGVMMAMSMANLQRSGLDNFVVRGAVARLEGDSESMLGSDINTEEYDPQII